MWSPGLYLRCADVDCLGKGQGHFISQAPKWLLGKDQLGELGKDCCGVSRDPGFVGGKWVYQVCGPGLLRTQTDEVSVRGFSWLPFVYLLLTVR